MKRLLPLALSLLMVYGCNQQTSENGSPKDDSLISNNQQQTELTVQPPIIDGIIDNAEWQNSKKYPLQGGDSIFFKEVNDSLYIAIRGTSGGFSSLGIANKNLLKIYHASTGLITAEYKLVNNKWQAVSDFKEPLMESGKPFPRNNERLSDNYKKVHFSQFNWYANLLDMGDATETEFCISKEALPDGELYLSLVFYQIKADQKMAIFPVTLDDDMLNIELIQGTAPSNLEFNIDNWISLSEILK